MSYTGWSLQDHIDELRNKLALKERDHRAYFECSQIAKKQNEDCIIHLRKQCKEKRVELSNSINEDEKVIGNTLTNRRRERLSLRRSSAPQAISIMDQKMCEKAKLLNELKHKREKTEAEITNLKVLYSRNEKLESDGAMTEEKVYQQQIRTLENSIDKAKIKIDTAVKVQVNYKHVMKSLEKESLAFPDHLKKLESAIVEQKMELAEMKEIHRDALAGKETIKSKLAKFEQEIFGAKRTRDKALNTMKKQAEKQKDIAEKAEKRVVRATLQTMDDTNDPRMQSRIDKDNLVKIFEYEDSVRLIMDAISISDVEDILHRVVDQQNTSTHLQEQTEFLAKQLVLLKTRKANILKEFESMKYSGERKTVNQTLVNKMENRLVDEMKRSQVVSEDLTRKEQVMVKTCTGVESLYHKLLSVKLPPPQRSYAVDGDALDQLGLIEKKLQILLDLLKLKDSNIVRKILAGIEFQEYMENILPAENVRIQIQEEETYVTSGLDYDSQDNEDTLTREDIKNRGQKILEKKTRKRGRKRKN